MNGLQSTASASRKVKKAVIIILFIVTGMCRKPTGRTLGRALSCLELMRTRAPPAERLSYRA